MTLKNLIKTSAVASLIALASGCGEKELIFSGEIKGQNIKLFGRDWGCTKRLEITKTNRTAYILGNYFV